MDVQDNFVSHTMQADQQANLARIHEQKSKCGVINPLEPLIVSLIKSYVDDADLSSKLQLLYKVTSPDASPFLAYS
jgi:hypothetical protein